MQSCRTGIDQDLSIRENILIKPRLDNHTPNNHLTQNRMQRLEIENQVQLAHILKQPVQRLDKDLYQIQQRQR